MASKLGTYDKERLLYDQIIRKYHPEYKYMNEYCDHLLFLDELAYANRLNCEFLVEECMSYVGKLEHTNIHGMDFTDGSDCKTFTLHPRRDYPNLYRGRIEDVYRKQGVLRCICYNPVTQKLDFFMFDLKNVGFDKVKSVDFNISYNIKKDSYARLDEYRVGSFEELCQEIKN